MSKVEVDFELCESNGVCMGIIPEVFDLDDQDYLHVLQDEVTPENEDRIKEAVRQCPRQATTQWRGGFRPTDHDEPDNQQRRQSEHHDRAE